MPGGTLRRLRDKARGMTAGELAQEAARRAKEQVKRKTRSTQAARGNPHSKVPAKQAAAVAAASLDVRPAAPGLRNVAGTADRIRDLLPDAAARTIATADAMCRNELRPFGGEPVQFGRFVDWRRDYVSGRQWPADHYTSFEPVFPDESDIRRVWEVSRLQHLVVLGRAFALTGDEAYGDAIAGQLKSWIEENPVEFGPNWTNAMEAAIRVANILLALRLAHGSKAIDSMRSMIATSIVEHGRFIEDNLEYSHRVTSNHYLSDLVGLLFIGLSLPDLPGATAWAEFAWPRLLEEVLKQINPDGTDYEASTAYHRFVLELVLHALLFGRETRHGDSETAMVRMRGMFDVVRHTLRPDGTSPLFGDSDDGRLFAWSERAPDDYAYLLPVAAVLFEDETFKATSQISEEALWLFGDEGWEAFEHLRVTREAPSSRAFADGGLYAMRSPDLFIVADCGGHGIEGRGSHNHNDTLGFDLAAAGRRVLVDPGSYVYTASEEWRNRFRSTLYHNTIRIDGEEISPFAPGAFFALGADPQASVSTWETGRDEDRLVAEHCGYARLADPVVHRRSFRLLKHEDALIVEDALEGQDVHRVELSFTLDPACSIVRYGERFVVSDSATLEPLAALIVASNAKLEPVEEERFVSRAYGHKSPTVGLVLRGSARLPVSIATTIVAAAKRESATQLLDRAARVGEPVGRGA